MDGQDKGLDGALDGALDVVVLVGGRSRRLGQNKAEVVVGQQRQVDRVVAAAKTLGGQVILATARTPPLVAGTRVATDHPDLQGPLAGIVAGLSAARTPLVGILAVDLEAPSPTLLRVLARLVVDTGVPGAVPVVDGRWQHLHAVLRRDLSPALLASGPGSVRVALDAAGVVGVDEDRWRRWVPDARPDQDIDTADDLQAARVRHAHPRRGPDPGETG